MAATMNLTGNGYMAVAGGYPVRLFAAGDSVLSGVIPKLASTVTAVVTAEAGTASVHMALFTMPTTSGGNDGAVVTQVDTTGVTTENATITLTVPDQTAAAPKCYVLRIWADAITGSNADTISRDGSTATTNEPRIPTGVLVYSVTVS